MGLGWLGFGGGWMEGLEACDGDELDGGGEEVGGDGVRVR